MKNLDKKTVQSFGDEWSHFDQTGMENQEAYKIFKNYFSIFPFKKLSKSSEGFDMGCGSGRWAKFVAPRVHHLNCIDPSKKALNVAKKNLSQYKNISFYNASVSDATVKKNSQDFGYCLGVLHHIPNTKQGIKDCASLLKKNAPFLLYLYYNFENRSSLFKALWKISNLIRKFCSIMPTKFKILLTTIIAYVIYLPLARMSLILEKLGLNVNNFPLSDYRNKSFYFMKTDSLDRFGTRLEKRFSKDEITEMLEEAGFKDIQFSNKMPMWVCISRKA